MLERQESGKSLRERQIAGIRELADWLEAHPDIPVPHALSGSSEFAYELIHAQHGEDQKAVVAAVARALPGKVDKKVLKANDELFSITGRLPGGIWIKAIADRDEVCERVVTGTREVTEELPDPEAPKVTVTRTVEDVEWVCGSILAGK
jgi:hypothetical protein